MATTRIINWFATERGRQFTFYAAGAVSSGVLVANFLPHTLLLDFYRDQMLHLYRNGLSVPLSRKLHNRFQKALDMLEVKEIDKSLYKPFAAYGFDIVSAGSAYSKFGVVVGLPSNFEYDNVDSIEKSKILVNYNKVDWTTEEAKNLLQSLILSENAQLYAMAREIKYRESSKPLLDVFFSSTVCITGYIFGHQINNRLNMFAKPLALRVILYTLVGLLMGGNYIACKDITQIQFEERIDKELKEKSKVFSEGGKEFYDKILKRNMALRTLLGKQGEKMYTVLGNENYLFRNKHTPLVYRKLFFDQEPVNIAT